MKQTMRDVVDDIIFYDPPQRIIIRGFGTSGRMRARPRLKPRSEQRPNEEDYEKLLDLYLKLSELADTLYKT